VINRQDIAIVFVLVISFGCSTRHTKGVTYDEAGTDARSARRTMVAGHVLRDCPVDLGPAQFVRIELVATITHEVIAFAETDHSGNFVIRSDYLIDPTAEFYLRFGNNMRMTLPEKADNSFHARLLVPCTPLEPSSKLVALEVPPKREPSPLPVLADRITEILSSTHAAATGRP
jgi:hypothetical protein